MGISNQCFADNNDKAAPLSAFCKTNALTGKWLQRQYEADLNSAVIWVFSLYIDCDTGEFIQTQGTTEIENIGELQKTVPNIREQISAGYAWNSGKFWNFSRLSGKWLNENGNQNLELERIMDSYSYFSSAACLDLNSQMKELEGKIEAIRKRSKPGSLDPSSTVSRPF